MRNTFKLFFSPSISSISDKTGMAELENILSLPAILVIETLFLSFCAQTIPTNEGLLLVDLGHHEILTEVVIIQGEEGHFLI